METRPPSLAICPTNKKWTATKWRTKPLEEISATNYENFAAQEEHSATLKHDEEICMISSLRPTRVDGLTTEANLWKSS